MASISLPPPRLLLLLLLLLLLASFSLAAPSNNRDLIRQRERSRRPSSPSSTFTSPSSSSTSSSPSSPSSPPTSIGNIQTFLPDADQGVYNITCDSGAQVRVIFYSPSTIRIWMATDGNFTDPAGELLVVANYAPVQTTVSDAGDAYVMRVEGSTVFLAAQKQPLLFSMYDGNTLLWQETVGLTWNDTTTTQTLAAGSSEYFFGGGMQNGRFSHKGHQIHIATDGNWADGGNPNAAPFYLSNNGYGVFRNTFAPAIYDFTASPIITAHNETRFDAFFFAGDFKGVLNLYTIITGRPFLPPLYGMGLGDSDCYHNNRHGNSTRVVIGVADEYRSRDMPGAWFLPNDGYGCGFGEDNTSFPSDFTDLDYVVSELHKRGFYTGLWSSTGLPNITREVAGSGTRIMKTDVGWIGDGYDYAFAAVETVVAGIEQNSDARRFIWTVEGWAGTQRNAVMWCGDDYGTFDYIRWQITTFVGTGFSAFAHVSGDIDGIFGGSPDTYTRDLQFKCFMTVMMTMSGWAQNPDKQPWTYGEPYESINRMYLKLKSQLTPYFYTYSRIAYDTGVPPVRALALEFPDDINTLVNNTGSAYQFMAGEWFLVAPVYQNSTTRDGIYLPEGRWVDYWDGTVIDGPITIDGYDAPLDKLPVFVKAGAIIPMWPEMNYFDEKPHDPIIFDVYPTGSTSFTLYEDDGVTRLALNESVFATTLITCDAPSTILHHDALLTAAPPLNTLTVNITIGATQGSYAGQLSERAYWINLNVNHQPSAVRVNGRLLKGYASTSALDYAGSGWFHNPVLEVTYIKLPSSHISTARQVVVSYGTGFDHVCLVPCVPTNTSIPPQAFSYSQTTNLITLKKAPSYCLTIGNDDDPGSQTPAIEVQPCSASKAAQQQWNYDTTTGHILPVSDSSHCMDQDEEDLHVEMYYCYNPPDVNQQWSINANNTGLIQTKGDGNLCMTPCSLFAPEAPRGYSVVNDAERADVEEKRKRLKKGWTY